VERYLKKGAKVYIEGQLETRKWMDQEGKERYSTEVVLRPFRGQLSMLDAKDNGSASANDDAAASNDDSGLEQLSGSEGV